MLYTLSSLFRRNGAINRVFYFGNRSFTASIHKRSNIKRFTWMIQHVVGNGSGRFAKYVAEDIIQFEVGNRQAVLCAVLLTGQHICELDAITD